MRFFAVFFIVIGFSATSFAERKCLHPDIVYTQLSQFEMHLAPGADPKSLDYCETTSPGFRVLQGLELIRIIEFPSATEDVHHSILSAKPWSYIKKYVKNFRFVSDKDESCMSGAAAYVMHTEKSVVHICPVFGRMENHLASAVLLHEVRHLDEYNFGSRHTTCDHGALKGREGACDPSYDYKGAYAVSVEYSIKLSRHPKVKEESRIAARAEALTELFDRFNQIPLGIAEGPFVHTSEGQVWFWGPKLQKVIYLDPDAVASVKNNFLVTIDKVWGAISEYRQRAAPVPDRSDFAVRFVYTPPKIRKTLRDYISFPNKSRCYLFSAEIFCEFPQGVAGIRFSKIQPNLLSLQNGKLLLSDRNGFLYTIPSEYKEMKAVTEGNLRKIENPHNAVQIYSTDGGEIILDPYGKAKTIKGDKIEEGPFPGKVLKITAPIWYSPLLEKI